MAMDDVVQRVARAMCRAAGFDDAPDCVELEARQAVGPPNLTLTSGNDLIPQHALNEPLGACGHPGLR